MLSKHLIAAVLLIIVIALGTGIYFITKEKPEAELLPTQLTVSASVSTINHFKIVTLTATLTSNGAPVEGKIIEWSTSPNLHLGIPSLATDSSGQVSTGCSPGLSSYADRSDNTLTFIASFAGDNQYRGSTGSTSIEVKLAQDLSFETISHESSFSSRYENHEYLVIENSEEWERIWTLAMPEWSLLPEIDFSTHTVIAVFMGGQPTGGHGISIERITNVENEIIIVNVKETYPGRIGATLAFTWPRHIIKIERVQKPIVFEVRQFKAHVHDKNWNPYDEIMYELVGEHHVEAGSGPPEP